MAEYVPPYFLLVAGGLQMEGAFVNGKTTLATKAMLQDSRRSKVRARADLLAFVFVWVNVCMRDCGDGLRVRGRNTNAPESRTGKNRVF